MSVAEVRTAVPQVCGQRTSAPGLKDYPHSTERSGGRASKGKGEKRRGGVEEVGGRKRRENVETTAIIYPGESETLAGAGLTQMGARLRWGR